VCVWCTAYWQSSELDTMMMTSSMIDHIMQSTVTELTCLLSPVDMITEHSRNEKKITMPTAKLWNAYCSCRLSVTGDV